MRQACQVAHRARATAQPALTCGILGTMDNVRPIRPPRHTSPRRPGYSRRRLIVGLIVVLVVVLIALSARIAGFYVDWLWFGEVGFRSVFWTRLWTQLWVGLAAFGVFFVIVFVNVEIARRLAPGYRVDASGEMLEPRSDAVRRWVGLGGLGICLLAAFAAGVNTSSSWLKVLLGLKGGTFGVSDPVFHHDVGFYVFSVPALHVLQSLVFGALLAALVLAAIMHLIMGGIEYSSTARPRPEPEQTPFGQARAQVPQVPQIDLRLGGRAVAHLSAILAAIFVVAGVGQLFRGWSLLYSTAGAVFGAGATDVALRLPLTRVTMVIAFILAALLIYNIWRRHQWWPITIALWVLALIVLRGLVPAAYQSLVVNPNQLAKERGHIAANIKATKQAYDLNSITQQPLSPKKALTPVDLIANQPTLSNIRLWDPGTLVTSYRQLQELRPYYSFLDADVDRYTLGGVYKQTMLSPRELNIAGLPSQAQTWVNQHITFTHGYGVAMSAVNQVTPDGSPDFLVSDIPARTAAGLEITQPRIYYGERGTGYSLVDTKVQEFDYPGPNGDVYTTYKGSGGISISSFLNRVAFSVHYGTIKFLTTSAIGSRSRIIIRNDIQERIRAAAPFLQLDTDPYMVISGGKLYWIQDAYTTTSLYPYSSPQGGLNYIRNSVKIVIDAYNGTMKFFVFDDTDPLLKAYQAAFPKLFTPRDQIPADLLRHVRYPEDLFDIQAETYTTYHVDDPALLYNKGDQWQIPDNVSLSGPGPMQAYYVIMKLPGATKEEFLLMLPFVPNGRSNMISWLGARSDVPDYGKALNFIFSKSTTVFGPSQVEATVNQDPDISAQRTLWGQEGSRVILGNLLVIPIEDSLLYVQPLYLQADQPLPQLKRVIVFYRSPAPVGGGGNATQVVAMKPTLAEALTAAFGQNVSTGTTPGQPTPGATATPGTGGAALSAQAQALIAKANSEFQASQTALRAGDFAEYGRQVQALKQTLSQLQALQ
jgi:uncharacterized protein